MSLTGLPRWAVMFLADSLCICPSIPSEKGLEIPDDCGFLDSPAVQSVFTPFIWKLSY